MTNEMINCDVIQDLLPLYEDGCCSDSSRQLVEQHLAECEDCRKKSGTFQEMMPDVDEEAEAEEKAIRRGIKRIKGIRMLGVAALTFTLAVFFVIIPVSNEMRGSGYTYSNIREIQTAKAFLRDLKDGQYEDAYKYLLIEDNYNDLISIPQSDAPDVNIGQIEENGFQWYDEVCREKFLDSMKKLEQMDEMIASYSSGAFLTESSNGWDMRFEAVTVSGQEIVISLSVGEDGIQQFSADIEDEYDMLGTLIEDEQQLQKELVYSRLYRRPTMNETVMEILYRDTDFDWMKLFEY